MANATAASPDRTSSAFVVLALCGIVLLAGATTLWAYYGTTVFFEMLTAGLAYCF
jgi:hypothetical protein